MNGGQADERQRRVVTVGYDGSPRAARAVEWAATEAIRRAVTLRVVACYSEPSGVEPWAGVVSFDAEIARASAEQELDGIVTVIVGRHPNLDVKSAAILGTPIERLVAEGQHCDLLVLGTAGHSAYDAWWLGSVSHAVSRHAQCPVVLVPNVDIRTEHGRVLVGVDGSPPAWQALSWAGEEADRRDAELLIAHVWSYPYGTELSSPAGRDFSRVDAALTLDAAVEQARARQRAPVGGRLMEGSTALKLADLTATADLIVLGSRGQSLVRSMLFGSVTQAVSARASCPTVVVREHPPRDRNDESLGNGW